MLSLQQLSDFLWGVPLLLSLVLLSLYTTFASRFFVFKQMGATLRTLFKSKAKDEGISPLGALSNTLSACVGLGNMAGVAIAIRNGGPGAVFWMWVAAFMGMNTRFYEVVAAMDYRSHDRKGLPFGGPMYALPKVFKGRLGMMLGYSFAIFALVGTLSLFQMSQFTLLLERQLSLSPLLVGSIVSFIVFFIIKGGGQTVTRVTTKIVPTMGFIFIFSCLFILWHQRDFLWPALQSIFVEAFQLKSVAGGLWGYAIMEVIRVGFRRAIFSNEAGVGTSSMAHCDSSEVSSIKEGLQSSLGPFFDTIVICSLTAMVILVTNPGQVDISLEGMDIVLQSFELIFSSFGPYLLMINVTLFATSTIIGMAYYNQKCFFYLFGDKSKTLHALFYSTSLFLGSLWAADTVVNIIDIAYALMAFPNIFLILKCSSSIHARIRNYDAKRG